MDQAILVDPLLPQGRRLLEELQRNGVDVSVAAWVLPEDVDRWALVIASSNVDAKGPIGAYKDLTKSLRHTPEPQLSVTDVKLIGRESLVAKELLAHRPARPLLGPQRATIAFLGGEPVQAVWVYPSYPSPAPRATILKFVLRTSDHFRTLHSKFTYEGSLALNKTEWRGKEPRTCAVSQVRARGVGNREPVECEIEVSYRPPGYITFAGGTRYDGWSPTAVRKSADGVLLDANGQPLEDGHPPVYAPIGALPEIEFNELDFGEFVGETETVSVERVPYDAVMKQIFESGRVNASINARFVAPRRNRPLTKLVLIHEQWEEMVDGFGTHFYGINVKTPHLQQVVQDHVTKLIIGFVEGRLSIKNTSSDDLVLVDLTDTLVDTTPCAQGLPARFDRLAEYLPDGYLEELALRLEASYMVKVSVVEGTRLGLVLRQSPE